MAERSPSEFFIKFLISQQEHETNAILRLLENYGLDGLTGRYIDQLRVTMDPFPDPWEPTKTGDTETRRYLKKHGIANLWYPHASVKEAYKILTTPQLRANVQQLLLSPLRVEEVTTRLNKHHSISLTVAGLEAFGHYFWNKSLLAMHEWVNYLDGRPEAYDSITVLRASPDTAQSMVPWVAGLSGPPPSLNTGTVARRMRDVAFLKVLEVERQPATLAHSKMMKNYMDVIKAAESEMRQSDVALKDVLSAFDKFRLRKDDAGAVPSIEEVAGPNYSKSGAGTDEAEPVAEDYGDDDG